MENVDGSFMQEILIEGFLSNKHNGWHNDIKAQSIHYRDPYNSEHSNLVRFRT